MNNLASALTRARFGILSIALVYAASVTFGIFTTHLGYRFALDYRDRIVGDAVKTNETVKANLAGNTMQAALMDFAGNLLLGSVPQSVMGMTVVVPYPFVAYQGWVGGIVSVRGDHSSRLNTMHSAVYYLLTLLLQLAAYSISIGAGVNMGIAMLRPAAHYQGEKLLRIFPKEALRDWGRLYLVAIPIFLVGSLWEFLSSWNY